MRKNNKAELINQLLPIDLTMSLMHVLGCTALIGNGKVNKEFGAKEFGAKM